ncbi:hypothetical protein LCGC14_2913490, partial [marine sediment metagenome]
HITVEQIFKIRQSDGDFQLPHYLVSRILLKGNRKYYYDKESYVKNLFSSEPEDPFPDPFVRIAILQWLRVRFRVYGPNNTKGYHKVESLIKSLQKGGHSSKRVLLEIRSLTEANCIHAETQSSEISEDELIAISFCGLLHLDMVRNIDYLSTISEDSWFRENQPAKKIANNLTGKGKYKTDSRQSTINNSSVLVEYLAAYFNEYLLGNATVLSEEKTDKLIDIKSIQQYVNNKTLEDKEYNRISLIQEKYTPGSEVIAQIVSVKNYGVFVEFDLGGTGFIHNSKFGNISRDFLDTCDEGDQVVAEVLDYNTKHGRFDLSLKDHLPTTNDV